MRIILKLLWNLIVFFTGVVVGGIGEAFVVPFFGDFGYDFPKYAHVASYWIKANYPGAAGEKARCEQEPKIEILKEGARFQRWDEKLTSCSWGSPFADHHGSDCSLEEKYRAEHLAKLDDAKKRLAACSPQPHP